MNRRILEKILLDKASTSLGPNNINSAKRYVNFYIDQIEHCGEIPDVTVKKIISEVFDITANPALIKKDFSMVVTYLMKRPETSVFLAKNSLKRCTVKDGVLTIAGRNLEGITSTLELCTELNNSLKPLTALIHRYTSECLLTQYIRRSHGFSQTRVLSSDGNYHFGFILDKGVLKFVLSCSYVYTSDEKKVTARANRIGWAFYHGLNQTKLFKEIGKPSQKAFGKSTIIEMVITPLEDVFTKYKFAVEEPKPIVEVDLTQALQSLYDNIDSKESATIQRIEELNKELVELNKDLQQLRADKLSFVTSTKSIEEIKTRY